MKSDLKRIESEIARLRLEADRLHAKEVDEVIERIKVAISHYELLPADLFGTRSRRLGKAPAKQKVPRKGKHSPLQGRTVPVKYKDDQGNTWTGRGNKPRWLSQALGQGKRLEDFLI